MQGASLPSCRPVTNRLRVDTDFQVLPSDQSVAAALRFAAALVTTRRIPHLETAAGIASVQETLKSFGWHNAAEDPQHRGVARHPSEVYIPHLVLVGHAARD